MENAIQTQIDQIERIDPRYKKLIALSQLQVATTIGVSASTLENWRKAGIGPRYCKINNGKKGRILYPKTSIAEWLCNIIATA